MSGDREDRLIEGLGDPEDFVWQSLRDAVSDLALGGCPDAPTEALRRLCEGEWFASGQWRWLAWVGARYAVEREGSIPAERWKGLKDGMEKGLAPWPEGEPLPTLSNEFIFSGGLPAYEKVQFDWTNNRVETALLTGPEREEWFSAVSICVCEPPSASPVSPSRATEAISKGGRPPTWDWEAAALAMAGRYFVDIWKPESIADVVRAMQDWASAEGLDLPDRTAHPHAKRIFEAIQAWDKAP